MAQTTPFPAVINSTRLSTVITTAVQNSKQGLAL